MMLLSEVFDTRHIKLNLESRTKDEVFRELVETITGFHPELDREEMIKALSMRENRMNTAVMPGIAVPHGYCHELEGAVGAIGISRTGIVYNTDDAKPVHYIFMLLMGDLYREKHLCILGSLLNLFNSQIFSSIETAKSIQEIHDILYRF